MKYEPRILIIEDNEAKRARLVNVYREPPLDWCERWRVCPGRVDFSETGADAVTKINQAASANDPFDLVTLDLTLPWGKKEDPLDDEAGFRIIRESKPAGRLAMLVDSRFLFKRPDNFRKLLVSGVTRFVSPDASVEESVREGANAFWGGVRAQWQATLDKQERRRDEFDRALVADKLAKIVSDNVGQVLDKADDLADTLGRRFQLDTKSSSPDPVVKSIEELRQAALQVSRGSAQERQSFRPTSEKIQEVTLENLARTLKHEMLQGVLLYDLDEIEVPLLGESKVHTFQLNMEFVLRELLIHAIENSEAGSRVKIEVRKGKARNQTWEMLVSFIGTPLEAEVRQAIEEGDPSKLPPETKGLGLAARAGRNVGVALSAEVKSGQITFIARIPLTSHDKSLDN